ncbi:BatD family protein [Desulfobacterota bacterium M19]
MKRLIKTGRHIQAVIGWQLSLLILTAFLALWAGAVLAADISVNAVVDQQHVSVGEGIMLQIQVDGNDSPGAPDLSALTDFKVESLGGQQNSSSSISFINGQLSKVSHEGYVFNYRLTPRKAGQLIIPALKLHIAGRDYFTTPIDILAMPPHELRDFKLRLRLEKNTCYVGEPVRLTVSWYIGRDVKGFNFNLPFLRNDKLRVRVDSAASGPANKAGIINLTLDGGLEVAARKGTGRLQGHDFTTLTFSLVLVPRQAGTIKLAQATVSAKTLAPQARSRSFSPFFNDNFFGQSLYQSVVVPSNTLELIVKPLPAEGRPADFNGLVGNYSLLVMAVPRKVRVGDPITLTIQVAGPYADYVHLPSLRAQLPARDFKVPVEMAPGEGQGPLKTFTQTVRVRHPGVKSIPPLSLSFFNVKTGRYETIHSKPVPLQVSANRVVTAADAQGLGPVIGSKQSLKQAGGGINYNYETPDVLVNEEGTVVGIPGRVVVGAIVGLPPLFYLLALLIMVLRHRLPALNSRRAARNAYQTLRKELREIKSPGDGRGYERLSKALTRYLRLKLDLKQALLTNADIREALYNQGVGDEEVKRMLEVLKKCEAGVYAGSAAPVKLENLLAMAGEAARKIDLSARRPGGGKHEN